MLATNEHVQKGKGKGSWPIHVATKFLVKPGERCLQVLLQAAKPQLLLPTAVLWYCQVHALQYGVSHCTSASITQPT